MERQMALRAVSRQKFDRFGATRVTLTPSIGQAVEWFADDSGGWLRVVARGAADREWSSVIVGRGIDGTWRLHDVEDGFHDPDDARRWLFEAMGITTATGQRGVSRPPTSDTTRRHAISAPRAMPDAGNDHAGDVRENARHSMRTVDCREILGKMRTHQ
jgi:hypothetical protein